MGLRGKICLGALMLVISVLEIYAEGTPPGSPTSGKNSPRRKSQGSPSFLSRSKSMMKKYSPIDTQELMKISVPPPVANSLCDWNKVFNRHTDMNNACTKECTSLSEAGENLIKSHPNNRSLRLACRGIKTGVCEIAWNYKEKHQIFCNCRKEKKDREGKVRISDTLAATCRYKLGALEISGNAEILGGKALKGMKAWARGSNGNGSGNGRPLKKQRSSKGSGSDKESGNESS